MIYDVTLEELQVLWSPEIVENCFKVAIRLREKLGGPTNRETIPVTLILAILLSGKRL